MALNLREGSHWEWSHPEGSRANQETITLLLVMIQGDD